MMTPEINSPTMGPVTPPAVDPCGWFGRTGHACLGVPRRRMWVAWEDARRPGWLARPEPAAPCCHGSAPTGGRVTMRLRGSEYHCDEAPETRAAAIHRWRRILEHSIDNPGPYPAGLCYPDNRYVATTPGYAEKVA